MKNYILTLVLLTSFVLTGQSLMGVPYDTAKTVKTDEELKYSKRLLIGLENNLYAYYFGNPTPIAIRNSIVACKKILRANDLDFDAPYRENSYIDDSVDSIYDYKELSQSVNIEWSEVDKTWKKGDDWIGLSINKKSAIIIIGYK
jgi:hypothetical protein